MLARLPKPLTDAGRKLLPDRGIGPIGLTPIAAIQVPINADVFNKKRVSGDEPVA
jgi:hypothetical protein